jgi:hypothetical protein
MPMLRTIRIAVISVSMVNPVRSSEVRGAAHRTVKVIHQATEVATALMIFSNRPAALEIAIVRDLWSVLTIFVFDSPLRKNFSPPLDGRLQLSILPRSPSAGWQRRTWWTVKERPLG